MLLSYQRFLCGQLVILLGSGYRGLDYEFENDLIIILSERLV